MEHLADETTDLKLHTHLCAERYRGIQDQFERVEKRIDVLDANIDDLKKDYNDGNRSIKNTIITTAGSIIIAITGVIGILLTK